MTFIHIRQLEYKASLRAKLAASANQKLEPETKCSLATSLTTTSMQQPEEFTYINQAYATDALDANDVIFENNEEKEQKMVTDSDQDAEKLSSQI